MRLSPAQGGPRRIEAVVIIISKGTIRRGRPVSIALHPVKIRDANATFISKKIYVSYLS
jgi:hypothetical protein